MRRIFGIFIVVLAVSSSVLFADTDIYVDDAYYWPSLVEKDFDSTEPVYDKHAKELIFIDEEDSVAQPVDTVRMRVIYK